MSELIRIKVNMELSDIIDMDDAQRAGDRTILRGSNLYEKSAAGMVALGYAEAEAKAAVDDVTRKAYANGSRIDPSVRAYALKVRAEKN